jgi:hypothetical protein
MRVRGNWTSAAIGVLAAAAAGVTLWGGLSNSTLSAELRTHSHLSPLQMGAAHHALDNNPVLGILWYLAHGLAFALLMLILAPRATGNASRALDREPGRCLVTGICGLIMLGLVHVLNNMLFRAALWMPFGVILVLLSLALWVYSGLIGVTFAGGWVSRKMGWGEPGFLGRALLGMLAFIVVAYIPFLGPFTGFVELAVWVMGLGALVVTGLGSDPDWLTSRLKS